VHIADERDLAGELVVAHITQTSPWSLQADLKAILPTVPRPVLDDIDDDVESAASGPAPTSGSWLTLPMVSG
jgi:hypothetical protein